MRLRDELDSKWNQSKITIPSLEALIQDGKYREAIELALGVQNQPDISRQIGRICFLWGRTDKWSCIEYLKSHSISTASLDEAIDGLIDGILHNFGHDGQLALDALIGQFHETTAASGCMDRLAPWVALGEVDLDDYFELFGVLYQAKSNEGGLSTKLRSNGFSAIANLMRVGIVLGQIAYQAGTPKSERAMGISNSDLRGMRDRVCDYLAGNQGFGAFLRQADASESGDLWKAIGEASGVLDGLNAVKMSFAARNSSSDYQAYLEGIGSSLIEQHTINEVGSLCDKDEMAPVWQGYIAARISKENNQDLVAEIVSYNGNRNLKFVAAQSITREMFKVDSISASRCVSSVQDPEIRSEMAKTLVSCLEYVGATDEANQWRQIIGASH